MTAKRLGDYLDPAHNSFNLIRLLAASLVVVTHAFTIGANAPDSEPFLAVSNFTLGEHAVNVFFVVSGIFIYSSFERSSSVYSFVTARILRILPAYLVCVLLLALVMGPLLTVSGYYGYFTSPETTGFLFKNLFFLGGSETLPGVFSGSHLTHSVDAPLWTLRYEIACYIILMVAGTTGLLASRRVFWAAMTVFYATALTVAVQPELVPSGAAQSLFRFLFCFGIGMMAYRMRAVFPISGWVAMGLLVLFVILRKTPAEAVVGYLAFGYLAIWAATLEIGNFRTLTNKVDLSFGIYIYAWPIQQILHTTFPGMSPLGICVTALPLAGLAAYLSWTYIEKPALGLKKRLPALNRWVSSPEPSMAQMSGRP